MKVALLLRVRRRILARQDADETNVVGAIADDLERLHEPGETIALDAHLLLDLGGGHRGAGILGRGRRLGGSDPFGGRSRLGLGGAFGCTLGLSAGFDRTLGGARVRRRLGLGRLGDGRGVGRLDRGGFRRSGGRSLGLRRGCLACFDLGSGGLGSGRLGGGRGLRRTMGAANDCRLAQDGAGELGNGLHGASI